MTREEILQNKIAKSLMTALCLTALLSVAALAQDKPQTPEKIKDEANQSQKAAKVFQEIMDTPDKDIPKEILSKAECVEVFPDVIKAGFIVGGRSVASCRTPNGWSAPAYLNLGGGSFGLQIGADASVAAGPVGRQVGAPRSMPRFFLIRVAKDCSRAWS